MRDEAKKNKGRGERGTELSILRGCLVGYQQWNVCWLTPDSVSASRFEGSCRDDHGREKEGEEGQGQEKSIKVLMGITR